MAAESRLTRGGIGGATTDDGCKVSALDGKMVFVSGGLTRHVRDALSPGWDSNDLIREAYSKVKSENPPVHGKLAEVAKEWSAAVADQLNEAERLQPGLLRQFIITLGGAGAGFTLGYLGGLDDLGNLSLFFAEVAPNASGTFAESRGGPISACSDHGFCLLGGVPDLDVGREFANRSSERARKEAADWKPPKGTAPKDYDAFKTMRMLELVLQHHTGNESGGPIDVVQLNRDGSVHWYARKANCPEN